MSLKKTLETSLKWSNLHFRWFIQKTFKINSDQQAQLTQHLAARITELQQKHAKVQQIAADQKLGDKLSGQSKKKQGVVKVQEISAELLQQVLHI